MNCYLKADIYHARMLFNLLHTFYSTVGSDSFSCATVENTMKPSGRIAEVNQSHVLTLNTQNGWLKTGDSTRDTNSAGFSYVSFFLLLMFAS